MSLLAQPPLHILCQCLFFVCVRVRVRVRMACLCLCLCVCVSVSVSVSSVYIADAMGANEVDANDRPLYPPRILSTEVVHNPFDDIAPRDLAAARKGL